MRSKAIFMALLALAFQAQAGLVSSSDATAAANAWAARGRHFGLYLGQRAEGAAVAHATSNQKTFYSVKLTGGGTVFVSGDTEAEPIIAFTSDPSDFSTIDPKSPLWALLNRDLSQRQAPAPARAFAAAPTVAHAQALTAREANVRKWRALLDEAANLPVRRFSLLAAPLSGDPGDLRVPALMKTKWSQSGGIWNYYTPPGKDHYTEDNAVCGCVATAASQIMRYLHGTPDENGEGGLEIPFPKEIEAKTFKCSYRGEPLELTMQGGTYCWTNMPFTAKEIRTEEQKQNIGKLTSDVGISVNMMYDGLDGRGSGAVTGMVPTRWLEVFGYRQASWIGDVEVTGESGREILDNVLFANFDARRPCLMSIPGHAIVADGYGFEGDVPYVHLNMGWAGSCDLWYNLPDMTKAGKEFTAVNGIGYNVFPEVGGADDEACGIISGRVLDDDGLPVPECAVTVMAGSEVVTNLLTDAQGIWAAILPAGTYDVEAATEDREWIGVAEDVLLTAPAPSATETETGNSGGHDIVLAHPSVRLNGVEAEIFSSVDRAAKRAKAIAEETGAPVTFELIDRTLLKRDVTFDFDCVIVSTNDDPQVTAVERLRDAKITVSNGVSVVLTNAAFVGSAATLFAVDAGGELVVSAGVDLGVGSDAVAVETAASDGFVLAGPLDGALTLCCQAARNEGDAFGAYDCSDACADEAAKLIVNGYDVTRELRGVRDADGRLVWGNIACPIEDAAAYYVVGDETNTYARLDKAVKSLATALAGGTAVDVFVIRKSDTLTQPLSVAKPLKVRGANGAVVTCSADAGFTVNAGGSLDVDGVTFTGGANYVGTHPLLLVDGGTLTLGAGVVVSNLASAASAKTTGTSPALHVRTGKAVVNGATFDSCVNRGTATSAGGGAISVGEPDSYGTGYEFELNGGSIRNCSAATFGGGVYAYSRAEVTIGGDLTVKGNVAGSDPVADDIYIAYADVAFALAAPAGLASGEADCVGVRYAASLTGNDVSNAFISAVGVTSEANSANALFNDCDPTLAVKRSGDSLMWVVPDKDLSITDPDKAVVRVGGKLFASLADALETLSDDGKEAATFEVLKDLPLDADVVVDFPLTICSTGDVAVVVTRQGDAKIQVAGTGSLTLTNVVFNGGDGVTGLFDVRGATMTMKNGAVIEGVNGSKDRASGAVAVWEGGIFKMESGAVIRNCVNSFRNEGAGTGSGGGLLLDHATANLEGGVISNCTACSAGGVFANGSSTVNVSGDLVIWDNANLGGDADNLRVSENSSLVLSGAFGGRVGYSDSERLATANQDLFGTVTNLAAAAAADGARCFVHDSDGDFGQAVKRNSKYYLVWGSAITDGTYTSSSGAKYDFVDAGTPVPVAKPTAQTGLVYTGNVQTGVVAGVGYTLVGNMATAAGGYTATATLRSGFVWAGDPTETDPVTVPWSIAKADYDLSGVSVVTNFTYDGMVKQAVLEGELPAGVTAKFIGNDIGWVDAGSYPIRLAFTVADTTNYNGLADWDLTVVIEKAAYDMSKVSFPDGEFVYDGEKKSVFVDEKTLPDGVTVTGYVGNEQVTSGVYAVAAQFAGDEQNHLPIADLTATLTINRNPDMPYERGSSGPEIVEPGPIGIKSIERVDATTWQLVVTGVVEFCNYRLLYTDDLAKGFSVTGDWQQATAEMAPTWTTNAVTSGGALFWRAEAKEGSK